MYEIGYTEAWFEPRNRWGGAKFHAVDPDAVRHGKQRVWTAALCGATVTPNVQTFDPTSVTACKRCARAVAKRAEVAA